MGASYKKTCIVLKKTKLKEADLILTMLDEDGRQLRGVAKGARKPGNKRFGARLEPFSLVELQLYPGRSLESITEVACLEPNAAVREDLDRSSAAALMAEFAEKSTRDGELDARVFSMLAAALERIASMEPQKALIIAIAFVLKALSAMGLRPSTRQCAQCGEPVDCFERFCFADGGCLCEPCSQGHGGEAAPAVVGWVDALIGSTYALLEESGDAAPLRELLDFTERWVDEHTGLHLKTIAFLRMSLNTRASL